MQGLFATEWVTEGKIFRKQKQQQRKEKEPSRENYFTILQENNDIENENRIAYHIANDIQCQDLTIKNKRMEKKVKAVDEKYAIECMTVDILEAYLSSLKAKNHALQKKVLELEEEPLQSSTKSPANTNES